MTSSAPKNATRAGIVLAFASVYFFWGSTYTAIRIGTEQMPALLLSGLRFFSAGLLLLLFCRTRGMKLLWPRRDMLIMAAVGLLLLAGGNVGLVYAEKFVPSGLAALVLAVVPLYVAFAEMALPGGEPLPRRGWLGMVLGFLGLIALMWPSLRMGLSGQSARLTAIFILMAGGLCWAAGSLLSRRARMQAPILVAASWQMIFAGAVCVMLATAFREWPLLHVNSASIGSLAYLVTCGSLIGYTCFIYLLEHVPVAKVASHSYINPLVAVLLGILFLGERPDPAEFVGMAGVLLAVYLLTTAQMKNQRTLKPANQEELLPAE